MTVRRSPLAMMVLALLVEEPMHAYRMQQLIREREKHDVVNVAQRNSIYQTIERLRRDELIRVAETRREEGRPERIVYALTPAGRSTLDGWLADALATPAREFPEFPAALSFLPILPPEEAARRLDQRAGAIEARLREREAALAGVQLPRLFLVEDEYQLTLLRAELDWVRALVADLRSGALTWSGEWLADWTGTPA
ncbi:PadR family transcriptional regulator [Micromonospora sp. WMMA1949]|uniref:PadR family transcriptional regulator n=1 Tax=unclassified Micromonospora TaxID=2617518 RepID=UPI0022B6C105|nr:MULTISPECIES: PadR family transcriptional regulator [unclassified Micromonospora]MCZ7427548.1 PadR family transcriptional regulator [Micromonospora sp. WMMA1949]WBC12009.1 PadR family transcriptional regulator [Micromonospora sp. WMMA1947]